MAKEPTTAYRLLEHRRHGHVGEENDAKTGYCQRRKSYQEGNFKGKADLPREI